MTNTFITGQNSLANAIESVRFQDPEMADLLHTDAVIVALNAMSADKSAGQEAANRLRSKALRLQEIHKRVLNTALDDLGYD